MKKNTVNSIMLTRYPSQKASKTLAPISPMNNSLFVAPLKKQTVKKQTLTRQHTLSLDFPFNHSETKSISKQFSMIPSESVLTISPLKLKSKADYFFCKLQEKLASKSEKTENFEYEYQVYLEIYQEVAEFLKPFDQLLLVLLDGIKKYCINYTETGKIIDKLEKSDETLSKTLSENKKLIKDKNLLIKKLNKYEDSVESMKKEIKNLADQIKNYENLPEKLKDSSINTENLINNMLLQYEVIQSKNVELQEKMIEEKKNKKIFSLIRVHFPEVDKIIEQVNKEFN